jgi:TolB-like protein
MPEIYTFGPFKLDAGLDVLSRATEPLPLGRRAAILLRLLIERPGVPVSKDALIEAAWPGVAVEESNLTVQIAALRRVLGEEPGGESWIETLPRRGYRFIGPTVTKLGASRTAMAPAEPFAISGKPSIAVLPFQNLSGDPEQEYFADGIVEEIIIALARLRWLFVMARNSSFTYKDRAIDVRQAARELGVRYMLEGSVRRAADRVRVTGQLIDASTGAHLWADRFDRPLDDVFAVQDEITVAVVAAIEPSLRSAEIERVKRKQPESLDAYDLVLQVHSIATFMPDSAAKALPLLERALSIEPHYAMAHGYAAILHQNLFIRGGLRDENRNAAIRHAHAAITHGRDDAPALAMAGLAVGLVEHDFEAAVAAFEGAMAISPSYATAYNLGSIVLAWAGEAERAIDWGEKALRLSPFDSWNFVACLAVALAHFQRKRFEAAASAARKGIQCNPAFSVCYMVLAAALAALGKLDEAKGTVARLRAIQPGFTIARHCAGVGAVVALSEPLSDVLRKAGLPE